MMAENAQEERTRRILDAAVQLAERGGFDAVRLRDVAAHADVALATVYKRFKSKEDLLVGALARDADAFGILLATNPVPGDTAKERTVTFFRLATEVFCAKPNLARAVLRAVSSGEPELTQKVAQFQNQIADYTRIAMGGKDDEGHPFRDSPDVAILLQSIWYAGLVGWMGGLRGMTEVVDQVALAVDIMFKGVEG